MGAFKKSIAALLVLTVIGGLLPMPALAHRMTERVYDPSTGDYYRQDVPHRHRADGSIVVLEGSSYYDDNYSYAPYSSYSTYYSTPYYSSSYYRPYGYRTSSGVGPAILGAGLGYAIGRHSRR